MIHPKYFDYKISTDSIRYRIPLNSDLIEAVQTRFLPNFVGSKYASGTTETDYDMQSFQLITPEQMEKLPSNINALTCSFVRDEQYLQFYYSIPKIMYGHSAFMFEYPFAHLETMRQYLESILLVEVPPIETWRLTRFDVSYNFELPSLKDVRLARSYLAKMRIYGKRGNVDKKGNLTPYWPSKRVTRKFYSKYDDMLRPGERKKYTNRILTDFLTSYIESILRYEEEWHQKGLMRKLGLESAEDITVYRFMNYVKRFYNQEEHIKKIMEKFTLKNRKTDLYQIMETIETMDRPTKYKQLVLTIISKGLIKAKSDLSKSAYYRQVKALRDVGIDVELIHNDYHDELGETPDKVDIELGPDQLQAISTEEAFEFNKSFGVIPFPGERERLRRLFWKEMNEAKRRAAIRFGPMH